MRMVKRAYKKSRKQLKINLKSTRPLRIERLRQIRMRHFAHEQARPELAQSQVDESAQESSGSESSSSDSSGASSDSSGLSISSYDSESESSDSIGIEEEKKEHLLHQPDLSVLTGNRKTPINTKMFKLKNDPIELIKEIDSKLEISLDEDGADAEFGQRAADEASEQERDSQVQQMAQLQIANKGKSRNNLGNLSQETQEYLDKRKLDEILQDLVDGSQATFSTLRPKSSNASAKELGTGHAPVFEQIQSDYNQIVGADQFLETPHEQPYQPSQSPVRVTIKMNAQAPPAVSRTQGVGQRRRFSSSDREAALAFLNQNKAQASGNESVFFPNKQSKKETSSNLKSRPAALRQASPSRANQMAQSATPGLKPRPGANELSQSPQRQSRRARITVKKVSQKV